MQDRLQKYRFALIEARNITRARLEAEFRHGIISPGAFENAIERHLNAGQSRTPWLVTDAEQRGSLAGTRMAALEFYWEHRRELQLALNWSQEFPEAVFEAYISSRRRELN
ncbi:MAG TPA: hypothetical protein VFW31_09920 [Candidatus Angelobacter sp.]|nr:hypothetical protein [Candidatus Angelobacter sp.]